MTRRRWSEPGSERWLKMAAWLLLAAVVVYFVFRLGSALALRFGVIKRTYEAPMGPEPASPHSRGPGPDQPVCSAIPPARASVAEMAWGHSSGIFGFSRCPAGLLALSGRGRPDSIGTGEGKWQRVSP